MRKQLNKISIPHTVKEDLVFYMDKLEEEVEELKQGLMNDDLENIGEECFDVIQCAVNLLRFFNLDIEKENMKHIEKLEKRGKII